MNLQLTTLERLAYNVTHTHVSSNTKIVLTTRPTPIQAMAFELLALNPACTQQLPNRLLKFARM